jgi:pimeloyl-ACP methyl ester carboxylesterase
MPLAELEGININYKVEGSGDPLVLIMGFSGPMIGWCYQASFFKKYYRVVRFDNRGVGKSDKPQGPYTTKMMADDTIHLMNYLGIKKAHIMGASMGGMIAQELVINYPNRVNKLVLACTYASQDDVNIIPEMKTPSQQQPEKMPSFLINQAFNKPHYRFFFGNLSRFYSYFMGASGSIGIRGQYNACINHNTLDRLESITTDTLVIVGTGDRVINPISSDVIASKIHGAKLVKIKDGSHTFMFENRNTFNQEVLKFLTNNHED